VRQERVTQTSTGGSTASQTGNIIDGQVSGNLGLGLVVVNEPVEPLIGDDNAGLLGVNGGEGEVGRVTQGGLSDRLEECRLADVGKTNLEPLLD
jgi:PPE-repeat protein